MSALGVNLSSPAIAQAYQQVLDGTRDYLVLTYEKNANDLRVQVCEKGDLDYLQEEFSDGRIQYAFARVKDPNSQLPKFVLINWCGEGVPENRKGLFATHSATVQAFLKGYHVSIQARSEVDVEPKVILKRITDSSGSKYGAAGDAANTQRGGPIAPVGSSYRPVGTPDIKGLQQAAKAKPDVIEPVGTSYTPARSELANIRAPTAPSASAPPLAPRPAPKVESPRPTPPPAAPSPPPPTPANVPVTTPVPSAAKVEDDDKIKPVGTAYQPVRLSKPGKLGDRMAMFNQPSAAVSEAARPTPGGRVPSSGGPGKLTWSQRQEQAKKQREEDEKRSQDAIVAGGGGAPTVRGFGAASAPSAKAVPPPSLNAEARAPSPPPAPPAPPAPAAAHVEQVTEDLASTGLHEHAAEASNATHASENRQGETAVAIYDYEAAEEGEITLVEGQTISNIQQLDEGWWSGITPEGNEGLFPSAYVQLNASERDGNADPAESAAYANEQGSNVEQGREEEPEIPTPPPPPQAPPAPAASEDHFSPPPPPPAPPAPAFTAIPEAPPAPPAPPAPAFTAIPEAPPAPPAPPAPAFTAIPEAPPAPPAPPAPAAQSAGPVAIALYDYEAAEDNELSFSEGDRIVEVEFPSEEWWSGVNERTGSQGLFPANYTEMQE